MIINSNEFRMKMQIILIIILIKRLIGLCRHPQKQRSFMPNFRAIRALTTSRAFAATLAVTALIGLASVNTARAAEECTIHIKDHVFDPVELHVPADTKVKLFIVNDDPTPEEFESYDLNLEKIVSGNSTISVFIGPLDPGRYEYFGEFNMDTALGWIVAE